MKNKILKIITNVTAVVGVVAVSCLDSDSYVPHLITAVCIIWLGLFVLANREAL